MPHITDVNLYRAVRQSFPNLLEVDIANGLPRLLSELKPPDDAPKAAGGRRPRRRRPSIDPSARKAWTDLLRAVTDARLTTVERLKASGVIFFRTVEAFDGWCGALLEKSAADFNAALDESPPEEQLKYWTLLYTGALFAFAASAHAPWAGLSPRSVYPLRCAADGFAWWFSRREALAVLPGEDRLRVQAIMALFWTPPDARERLRLCQYGPCSALFLDASPTYRTRPAKGCRSSHSVLEAQGRRAARAVLQASQGEDG